MARCRLPLSHPDVAPWLRTLTSHPVVVEQPPSAARFSSVSSEVTRVWVCFSNYPITRLLNYQSLEGVPPPLIPLIPIWRRLQRLHPTQPALFLSVSSVLISGKPWFCFSNYPITRLLNYQICF